MECFDAGLAPLRNATRYALCQGTLVRPFQSQQAERRLPGFRAALVYECYWTKPDGDRFEAAAGAEWFGCSQSGQQRVLREGRTSLRFGDFAIVAGSVSWRHQLPAG